MGNRDNEVKTVTDAAGARQLLASEQFDVAIVDLTISNTSRFEPSYDVAEELLLDIFASPSLNAPGDLIGITVEDDALATISANIGPHLMSIIKEDKDGLWKKMICDRLEYIVRVQKSRLISLNKHFYYDVAIVTALDVEHAPFLEIYESECVEYFSGMREFGFRDSEEVMRRGLLYSVGRAGQTSAASAVQSIITQFRPSLVLMSGFCGGFEKKTHIGQVIFAESVVDWDFGKWEGQGESAVFVPRPEPINIRSLSIHHVVRTFVSQKRLKCHDEVLGRVSQLSGGRITDFGLDKGPVASGSAVVADPIIIARIKGINDNILAVDMEAFALYYAASNTPVIRPEFLMIKSVCDFCDRKKDSKDQEACAYIAARTTDEFIRTAYKFPRSVGG